MAYPLGARTVGREAIKAPWEKVFAAGPRFEPEDPVPELDERNSNPETTTNFAVDDHAKSLSAIRRAQ